MKRWMALFGLITASASITASTLPANAQGLKNLLGGHSRSDKKDDKSASQDFKIDLPPYYGPKKRLAVADMEIKFQATQTTNPTPQGGTTSTTTVDIAPPADFGTGLGDMLVTALNSTNRFILLERSEKGIQDIQKEQTLAGVDDASKAQGNKLMGAGYIVRGAVTEYTFRKSSTGGSASFLKGINLGSSDTSASVTLDIKIFDSTTGELIAAEKADGKASAKWSGITVDRPDFKFGAQSFNSSPLGHATREAIEKAVKFICNKMENFVWEAKIADVDEEGGKVAKVYLNQGKRGGLKVGDELEVFSAGRVLMDPDNPGRVIGKTEGKKIGRIAIESMTDDTAIAKVLEGEGFAAKCIVRFPDGKAPSQVAEAAH